jgi:hypothetical protein
MNHTADSHRRCQSIEITPTTCRQNGIMLRDGTRRDAHAQRASHYHCIKRTPCRDGSQWLQSYAFSPASDAETARVFAQARRAATSSDRVMESGTVCASASNSN